MATYIGANNVNAIYHGSTPLTGVYHGVTQITTTVTTTTDPYFREVSLLLQDSLTDESLQGQTLVSTGAQVTTSVVKYGSGSLEFTGGYLTNSGTSLAFGGGDFTLEFWLYMNPSATVQRFIWDARGGANAGDRPTIFVQSNDTDGSQMSFYASGYRLDSNSVLSLTTWHHVAFVRSGGISKWYIDGQDETRTLIGTEQSWTVNSQTRIGESTGTSSPLSGYIDDLRLTIGIARYTSNFTPPTAAFPATNGDSDFGDVSLLLQDSLTDESLQRQTLVINGNAQIDTSVKKYGTGSISMQATGDTIQMTVDSSLDFSGQFTVEAWVKTTTSNNFRTLWCHRRFANNGTDIFVLFFNTSTTLTVGIVNDQFAINASSILDGDWHHVAMVRDSTHLRLYLDGVQGGSTPSSATLSAIGLPFFIGTDQYYSARQFVGHMDEIRITNGIARYPNGTTFTPPTSAFPN